MRFSFVMFFILLGITRAQNDQTPPAKTLPLSPVELLAYLPAPPSATGGNWTLTQSIAYNEYEMEWLISHAIRGYLFKPIPTPGTVSAINSFKVTVKIDDTGYNPASNLMFASKASQTQGENSGSFPSISTTNGSTPVEVYWVGKRFIVTIRVENGNGSEDASGWLKLINTAKLENLPYVAATEVPRPFDRIRVDELDPKGSFLTKGYYTTWKESQEALANARADLQNKVRSQRGIDQNPPKF